MVHVKKKNFWRTNSFFDVLLEKSRVNRHVVNTCLMAAVFAVLQSVGLFAAEVNGVVRRQGRPQAPLSQARVTLFTTSLSFFTESRTDDAGRFSIKDVPPGTYQLGACALSFEYREIAVTIGDSNAAKDFSLGPETETGRWDIIGNTGLEHPDTAVLLPNGRIFYCHNTVAPLAFDPVTGQIAALKSSSVEQHCFSSSLLQDGRIIAVGGNKGGLANFRSAIPWVKSYNPANDEWQWMTALQLSAGRYYPGLARLHDGSFLVMGGGMAPDARRTNSCELFDPAAETWSYTGAMVNATDFPPCALLYTGEVLATWWPPQLYNLETGQWRLTGNLNQPNRGWPGHSDHSLILLSDGRALIVGTRADYGHATAMGDIYDPATQTWTLTSSPEIIRSQPEVTYLPDGKVLVAAGEKPETSAPVENILGMVKLTDLYDPAVNSWRSMAEMNWFREAHAVTLLIPDGRVVIASGTKIKYQYNPDITDIEAFSPPYLFRGVRPQITNISTLQPFRGSRISMTIAPDTVITSVVLMGTSAHTHWVDGGIPRRLVLPVRQNAGEITVTIPRDSNMIPLGHYMLFAMVDDIPSNAYVIQVKGTVAGDLNGSGTVNFIDFAGLASFWQKTDCGIAGDWCNGADLNQKDGVDWADPAKLFTTWLATVLE